MQAQINASERLFYNSIPSSYTRNSYQIYLQKFLQVYGYQDLNALVDKGIRNPKQVENEIIDLIIASKERGMKRAAITNYTKPVIAFCKISDIFLNCTKINKFMPRDLKSARTYAYSHEQIHRLLDIADERMTAVILLLCSSGMRIGGLAGLNVGSLEEIGNLFKIIVYEGEPDDYVTFCSSEGKKALETYFNIRRRHGEVITPKSPVIREQYDRTDHFTIAHPKHVKEPTLASKLVDLTEAAGIRLRVKLAEGQKAASIRQNIPVCNGMRRFYSTQLVNSDVQTEKRWLLEGHSLKANDNSYVHVSNGDLVSI
jgi:site-specific recombinase XerD